MVRPLLCVAMLVMATEGNRVQEGEAAAAVKGSLDSLCKRDCWATGGKCKKTYRVVVQGFNAYCEDYCEPGREGCTSKFPEADKSDDFESQAPRPSKIRRRTTDKDAELEEEAVTTTAPVDDKEEDKLTEKKSDLEKKIDVDDVGGDHAKEEDKLTEKRSDLEKKIDVNDVGGDHAKAPRPSKIRRRTTDKDAELEEEAVTTIAPVDDKEEDKLTEKKSDLEKKIDVDDVGGDHAKEEDKLTEKQIDLEKKIDVNDVGGDHAKAHDAVEQIQESIANCKAKVTMMTRDSCCLMDCFKMRGFQQLVKAKCITNCVLASPRPKN